MVDTKPYYGNAESSHTSYKEIYDDIITNNHCGYWVVRDRIEKALAQGNIPALVVCKHIKHCENLCSNLKKNLDKSLNIACVHVNTPDKQRKYIMQKFRSGEIDILVSTTIIARGKNFPKLRYMVNAAGMSSEEKTIQFLGRLVRTFKGKNKVYLDDIQYQGKYLSRHSRRRARYYKDENLKVIDLKKLWNRYKRHMPNDLPF